MSCSLFYSLCKLGSALSIKCSELRQSFFIEIIEMDYNFETI